MDKAIYSSLFADLTKNVQVRFDAVSAQHKRLFDNVLFEQYLKWDTPSMGLEFEELIGKYNITIAAPTIGDDSKEPIVGTGGFDTLKERMLNHAITIPMTIQEYRKVLQLLDSKQLPDRVKTQQLVDLMWGNVRTAVDAVLAKIDLLFLRALSNEGKVTLDDSTNPEGGAKGEINFNQPSTNIGTSTTTWIDTNQANVDCMEDIQMMLDKASENVALGKILCSPALISYMCRSSKMKLMVWGSDKQSRLVQLGDINAYLSQNGYPTIVPVRRIVNIQQNGKITPYSPWNEANMVFVPDGQLGVVKNAWANNELKQEAGVAYSNYGRVRVSQWGVGETSNSNGVEFTKAQCYALPVITEINSIYTLKTGYVKPNTQQ